MTIQQLLKTAPVTTLLLVSFIGLFIMQVLTGVDANNPSTEALLKWGANALPFTMGDDPWRLVSSAFLHIGLMHLLFNGFAMYFFGQIAEPMFGSAKFLALFLLAAIGGNLLNSYVTWQSILDGTGQPGLSAGASGGIMGIGAALLIAALFKISVNGLVLNLKSLILIMGINLVYGFAVPGIDNAGHIGGAVTGLVIALAIGIVHRQRTAAVIQTGAFEQSRYQDNIQSTIQNNEQTSYIEQPTMSNINLDNNAHFDDTRVNLPINMNDNRADIIEQKTAAKPALMWQLLPWLVMLLISIGFVWWWQDIHHQILQVLNAVE
ncbi:rhomboid family intramembrane serine protease [Psychrobacter okhotskensis]|uniref:rhomboid family intramembrane serine protease n=1 Tax=Psychrobacter okhotskensis TaxID=212403 RepID=UPI0015667A04|nr:rhomboid family intramembrane serine protease [Psychrobacter okhotskensis]NRD70685.1 rhomboid family intramembrane serine protease [Psychrobacter okhotskensis]